MCFQHHNDHLIKSFFHNHDCDHSIRGQLCIVQKFSLHVVSYLSVQFRCRCYEKFLYMVGDGNKQLSMVVCLLQDPVSTIPFADQVCHIILCCRFPNHKSLMK